MNSVNNFSGGNNNWWAGNRHPSTQEILNRVPNQNSNSTPTRRRFSFLDSISSGSTSGTQARTVARHFTRESSTLRTALNDLRTAGRNTSDVNGQIEALRKMVSTYNDLLSASMQVGGQSITRLEQELVGFAREFQTQLRRAGITMNRDGFMRINDNQMRTAAERGDISRIVNSSGSGNFAVSLARTSNALGRNPAEFLSIRSHVRPRTGLFNSRTRSL